MPDRGTAALLKYEPSKTNTSRDHYRGLAYFKAVVAIYFDSCFLPINIYRVSLSTGHLKPLFFTIAQQKQAGRKLYPDLNDWQTILAILLDVMLSPLNLIKAAFWDPISYHIRKSCHPNSYIPDNFHTVCYATYCQIRQWWHTCFERSKSLPHSIKKKTWCAPMENNKTVNCNLHQNLNCSNMLSDNDTTPPPISNETKTNNSDAGISNKISSIATNANTWHGKTMSESEFSGVPHISDNAEDISLNESISISYNSAHYAAT